MGKAVMLSIHKEWVDKIRAGEKTVECRKKRPKGIDVPFKVYLYETLPKNKNDDRSAHRVVGEFVCDRLYNYTTYPFDDVKDLTDEEMTRMSCLTMSELLEYESPRIEGTSLYCGLWGWHVTNYIHYERPKSLEEFGLKSAPQSWAYCEEIST